VPQAAQDDVYRECECGSGQKYKFCCYPIKKKFAART
jgi:uncharacterized protein YchJ